VTSNKMHERQVPYLHKLETLGRNTRACHHSAVLPGSRGSQVWQFHEPITLHKTDTCQLFMLPKKQSQPTSKLTLPSFSSRKGLLALKLGTTYSFIF
jgi:hypothetical protein